MKRSSYIWLVMLTVLASCAKQSSPTGGPKDETPPKLLLAEPKDQSTAILPEQLTLVFDEYVSLDNPSKGIVITPKVDKDKLEFTSLKNTVTVSFNQKLEDSTTYVIDFQKSVVDISEKNPAEKLKLVFSTGATIDSLSLSGKINFSYPNDKEDYKNVLVGIYPSLDSTTVFTAPPYYLAQVDTSGNFELNNIKAGKYLAYAWRDTNGNLKAEFKSEEYDFLGDTLQLNKSLADLTFNLAKADLTPIKMLRSANFGKNYDVILNRNPVVIEAEAEGLGKELFYVTSDKRMRFYPKSSQSDSIPLTIHLEDSLGFTTDTLLWAKFPPSDRRPEKLELSINSGKSFYQTLSMELTFNKPLERISTDSLYVAHDSAGRIPVRKEMLRWQDSLTRNKLFIQLSLPDSLDTELVTLKAADSTFFDLEGQFNEKPLAANYRKLSRKNLADELKGKIVGASPPFIIHLINGKKEIAYESYLSEGNEFLFSLLEPGSYTMRVIEDKNKNKRWDSSNFIQKRPGERVFYYIGEENNKELIVRGGWTLEDIVVRANPTTGVNFSPETSVDK
ncbi:MAG: Ig-like domain-containing protein [Algoriphagus sp.]